MIVSAALVPHSPLLVPSIGKEHREKLAATLHAYEDIEHTLYAAQPDTICIIAPHGARYPDTFSANLSPSYVGTLKAFGDFSTSVKLKSDALLIDRMQRALRQEDVPFTLTSSEELDFGYAVPLLLLTPHLPSCTLVPLSPSLQGGRAHFEFGRHLQSVFQRENRRVAVFASGDLSHRLSSLSPGGAIPEGPAFDEATRKAAIGENRDAYLDYALDELEKVGQCGFRPLATLLGVLDGMNVTPEPLAYEAPFGVGYLTVRYTLG